MRGYPSLRGLSWIVPAFLAGLLGVAILSCKSEPAGEGETAEPTEQVQPAPEPESAPADTGQAMEPSAEEVSEASASTETQKTHPHPQVEKSPASATKTTTPTQERQETQNQPQGIQVKKTEAPVPASQIRGRMGGSSLPPLQQKDASEQTSQQQEQ